MRRAHGPIAPIALTALLSACGADPPSWLPADGWLAGRCAASADLLIRSGDASAELEAKREEWYQIALAFSATTDQLMQIRSRAFRDVNVRLGGGEQARRFLGTECDDAALTEVRQRL